MSNGPFCSNDCPQATIQDLDEPLPSRMKQDVRVSVKWPEVENYKEMNIENSTKFLFLMGMLDLSVALGDKMLVFRFAILPLTFGPQLLFDLLHHSTFSQSLSTLSLIEKFLAIRPIPIPALSQNGTIQYTSETWKKGRTYYSKKYALFVRYILTDPTHLPKGWTEARQ